MHSRKPCPPGCRSSLRHWHAQEDEFILALEGEVTLFEGSTESILHPGDAACFPASGPVGHYLENQSDTDLTYLVVGTRAPSD
ncbi:cupin domain-containing protein [Yoonia sediminilitoris]|uniref:Cupin domain-containing protein n=1 Tax=Yoonia sediminilitoris TaxID=1286148 RepID=A0A2T6KQ38_9RHOB|nr:cupin domain-containing protein [Yoonia sediminilitoris]PUB18645.1 Cupin domain-containing protein [Yoonia sediminilitoris]RCW98813.1 cupin domain [Yoonia sediminilitoris]